MPFDNNGNYSLPRDMSTDDSAGIPILASNLDEQFDDISVALNKMLTRDGQGGPSTDLPMAAFKHVNVGKASARTQYARTDQVQDGAFEVINSTSITGNAALGGTTNPAFTTYAKGQKFVMELSAGVLPASTSATLNLNGVSALPITYADGTTPEVGDWVAAVFMFVYNAQQNRFEILGNVEKSTQSRYGATRLASADDVSAGTGSAAMTPPLHGAITGAGTGAGWAGFSATPSSAGTIVKHGRLFAIELPAIQATSNASSLSLTLSGAASTNTFIPKVGQRTWPCFVINLGAIRQGRATLTSTGVLSFGIGASGSNAFAVSGQKGIPRQVFTYAV